MLDPKNSDVGHKTCRGPVVLADALTSVLQVAEKPLSLGELSLRLRVPFRAVAYALASACATGAVDRLDGGLFVLRRRPVLLELFSYVHAC